MKPNSIAARRSAKSRDIQRLFVSTPFPQAALISSPRQLSLRVSPQHQHSPLSAKSNSERSSAQMCLSANFSHPLTAWPRDSDCNEDVFYKSGPAMILPNLFLGSEQVVADKECIVRNEIKYVLNVAKEINNPFNDQRAELCKIAFPISMESSPVSISSVSETLVAKSPGLTKLMSQSPFSSYVIPSTPKAISPMSPNDFEFGRARKAFQPPTYMKLNWSHDHDHVLDDFDAAFAFIDLARQSGASVLVACQQGISRSASLVIAYVMKNLGISLAEAYALVKSRSPHISPNVGLVGQLAEFENVLKVAA
ncbi:hypothetical protein HK096_004646 [Nowakowskiella sp. JEL0078]|nr:hypothetical protein HK096_004646 [Nowakowskiella sp. JEL0078]